MLHSQIDQRIPRKGIITRYTKLMGDVWAYEPPLLLTRLTAIGGKLSEMKGEMNNMNDTESRAWNLSPGSICKFLTY
jgi:hypothetical protein